MRKFLLLLITLGLFSCGSDDAPSRPAKLISSVVMTGEEAYQNLAYSFGYDEQNRLIFISQTGYSTGTKTFAYGENGKVSMITITGSGSGVFQLTYDDQNRLASYTANNDTTPVIYNGSVITVGNFTLQTNSSGDISLFDTTAIQYDSTKKGAFAEVSGMDPLVLMLIDGNSPFYNSKKAISAFAGTTINYAIVNTFDSDGFVTYASYTGLGTFQISYAYSN